MAPAQTSSLTEEQVIKHLMFHKALLGEDDPGRINHYIEIVKASEEGEHVAMSDPFDRAVALALELVLTEHLDPWHLDLVQFASLYLQRVRESPEVDLITAGRILLMAWRILKLQSDELKVRAEPPPPEEPEWDPWFGVEAEDQNDPDVMFNYAVIDRGEVPIDEKVRHKGDRKVTFMELLDALEEARVEAEARAVINARREEERAARKRTRGKRVADQYHKEDQEAEIAEVWSRINEQNGQPIPLKRLRAANAPDDVVKTLVSALFLARESRIKLWQDDFPFGTIFVQNTAKTPHEDEA